MNESGRVLGVSESLRGSSLAVDAALGATEITVESTDDFEEDGGYLSIGAVTYAFTAPDDDELTIPLTSALTVAAEEGDAVLIYPPAVERYAQVVLEDAPDVPVAVLVPHNLVGRMPVGLRDDGDMDAVEVFERSAGAWEVHDLLGRGSARAGLSEMDWRNAKGLRIILGDLGSDVGEYVFSTAEMVAENAGPVGTTFPGGGSGAWRQIGRTGVASGAVLITVDFDAKVTLSGIASVLNGTDTDYNVRFYLAAVDSADDSVFLGRQGTNFCNGGDQANNRHRQVTNERQIVMHGVPEAPLTYAFWWGFTNDSGVSRAAQVRNLKMTLRVTYAPDMPTAESPERAPGWTNFPDTIASYTRIESNDAV